MSSQTGYFSDRPYRVAGQVPTEDFIALWDEGGTFADDPPNADFTCTVDSEVVNYVVELTSPSMAGEDLSYSGAAVGDTVLPQTPITCEADSHLFLDRDDCTGTSGRSLTCHCTSNSQCASGTCGGDPAGFARG